MQAQTKPRTCRMCAMRLEEGWYCGPCLQRKRHVEQEYYCGPVMHNRNRDSVAIIGGRVVRKEIN